MATNSAHNHLVSGQESLLEECQEATRGHDAFQDRPSSKSRHIDHKPAGVGAAQLSSPSQSNFLEQHRRATQNLSSLSRNSQSNDSQSQQRPLKALAAAPTSTADQSFRAHHASHANHTQAFRKLSDHSRPSLTGSRLQKRIADRDQTEIQCPDAHLGILEQSERATRSMNHLPENKHDQSYQNQKISAHKQPYTRRALPVQGRLRNADLGTDAESRRKSNDSRQNGRVRTRQRSSGRTSKPTDMAIRERCEPSSYASRAESIISSINQLIRSMQSSDNSRASKTSRANRLKESPKPKCVGPPAHERPLKLQPAKSRTIPGTELNQHSSTVCYYPACENARKSPHGLNVDHLPSKGDSYGYARFEGPSSVCRNAHDIQKQIIVQPASNAVMTSTFWQHGLLGFPAEVRNMIYDHVIGRYQHKYEIKSLQTIVPRLVAPYGWTEAHDRLHGSDKHLPSASSMRAPVDKLPVEQDLEGCELELFEDPDSLMAWRYRRVKDLTQEDLARMSRRQQRRAPLWLTDGQKLTWGHFTPFDSDVQAERFQPTALSLGSGDLWRRLARQTWPSAEQKDVDGACPPAVRRGTHRGPAALGLTCRQVADEFLSLLYSRVEFSFSAATPTLLFFSRLVRGVSLPSSLSFPPSSSPSLSPSIPRPWTSTSAAFVTSIHLHHFAEIPGEAAWQYLGQSGLTGWERSNARREEAWAESCALAAEACVNLVALDVTVDVREPSAVTRATMPMPRLPEGVDGMWTTYADPEAMELAPWFQPLKPFRSCKRLVSVRVTYQPCPRIYACRWPLRQSLEAAFSRLLMIGPQRLQDEYDAGRHDWFLAGIGKASWQLWPIFGPLTREEAEEEGWI